MDSLCMFESTICLREINLVLNQQLKMQSNANFQSWINPVEYQEPNSYIRCALKIREAISNTN